MNQIRSLWKDDNRTRKSLKIETDNGTSVNGASKLIVGTSSIPKEEKKQKNKCNEWRWVEEE